MQRSKKRREPRTIEARIDPTRLIDVSGTLMKHLKAPWKAYVDRPRGVCVQVWDNATPGCDGTPWQGTLRVAVKHTRAETPGQVEQRGFAKPITWDDMQAIKDHFWPGRIAVEVYPPRSEIVNVADMRWMWVLPPGAVLPFNLKGDSVERLVSERLKPEAKPARWRSVAVWPETVKVGNEVGKNESTDTHDSKEAAEAVCSLLRREGLGGDRQVFPVSTRVEPVTE